MEFTALPRSYFDRAPAEVARGLLGKFLMRKYDGLLIVGRIVETEAYLSAGDSASHSHRGKDARNASMYKEAGHAYVHGMRQYFLLDVVTESEGTPSAVLIRAVEPVQGITSLVNGPGKVGMAFKITRALDGVDMTDASGELFIAESKDQALHEVLVSPRVGISVAKDLPLRFRIEPKL
jgi:DNA-3-methyladenine glycosylase